MSELQGLKILLKTAKGFRKEQIKLLIKELSGQDLSSLEQTKLDLLSGQNFGNEAADWYTMNRINFEGEMYIHYRDRTITYKTINSYARAVEKLLNTGAL